MDFELTEEQIMFRNLAREFVQRHVSPIIRDLDREGRYPGELIRQLGSVGLLGLLIPQEYGGVGVGRLCNCLVTEEIARVSGSLGVLVGMKNGCSDVVVSEWGSEEQKKKYLPGLAKGEIAGHFSLTEPNAGSDAASIETAAVLDGGEWVINGTKMFCSGASIADIIIVAAQTDRAKRHQGMIAFIVERGAAGCSIRDIPGHLGLRLLPLCEISFQDCRIPVENIMGRVGDGFKVFLSAIDDMRIAASATCVGICQGCIDACTSYVETRQQFGKPIGSFQLVQAMIADMVVGTEAARLLTYKAATIVDKGLKAELETSCCKLFASEIAQQVTYNAIQVHGGYGYVDEYPLERHFRDARAFTIIEGTSQIHKLNIGRHVTGINAFV